MQAFCPKFPRYIRNLRPIPCSRVTGNLGGQIRELVPDNRERHLAPANTEKNLLTDQNFLEPPGIYVLLIAADLVFLKEAANEVRTRFDSSVSAH
jgi:hypothetical protein